MSDDFLPRAHSKRLGELERSNWKSLRDGRNIHRIDPAIREIVTLLNRKGYRTFSSCSGGHPANPRWKINRHESGYLAFSPPSNVAFTLYLGLRKKNRDFTVEAQAVIDDGDGGDRETVCCSVGFEAMSDIFLTISFSICVVQSISGTSTARNSADIRRVSTTTTATAMFCTHFPIPTCIVKSSD